VAQIEQIQRYVPEIVALRDRTSRELQRSIQRRDWIDVSNFIHGPLGELRLEMINVSRKLLPKDQERASQLSRDFFDNLVKIDQAAKDGQSERVKLNYREALADLDNFLQLIPKPSTQQQQSEA
jgi:photosystem II protein PsbQ